MGPRRAAVLAATLLGRCNSWQGPRWRSRRFSTASDDSGGIEFRSLVESATRLWLQRVVLDLGLCPWAAAPIAQGGMKVVVEASQEADDVFRVVRQEAEELARLQGEAGGSFTTLVVAPMAVGGFDDDFLPLKEAIEELIYDDDSLSLRVQLVTFHPRYRFGDGLNADGPDATPMDAAFLKSLGAKGPVPEALKQEAAMKDQDDAADYTNRAPFPTFQILRFGEVEDAVASRGGEQNMAAVWERNVELLREMGAPRMRDLLTRCIVDAKSDAPR